MQDLAQLLYGVFMAARLGHMITKEKIEGLNIDEYIDIDLSFSSFPAS